MKRMQSGPVALCLVLAVAGAYAGSSTDPTKASGPTTVKEDDLEFMTKASQAGMAEVQEAQVASTKAMDAGVRSFAQQMIDDHSKANDAMKDLAAKKGVTLPMQLDSKHQGEVDKLAKIDSKKFDKTYVKDEVDDHEDAVDLFDKMSKKATDPDLRAFAATTLPTLQHHLAMAKELSKKTDK